MSDKDVNQKEEASMTDLPTWVETPATRAFNARISAPVCTPSGESHSMVSKVLADAMRDELLTLLNAEHEARVQAEEAAEKARVAEGEAMNVLEGTELRLVQAEAELLELRVKRDNELLMLEKAEADAEKMQADLTAKDRLLDQMGDREDRLRADLATMTKERDWLADPENICLGYTKEENIERAGYDNRLAPTIPTTERKGGVTSCAFCGAVVDVEYPE